jgi:hypothetical protein
MTTAVALVTPGTPAAFILQCPALLPIAFSILSGAPFIWIIRTRRPTSS